MNLIKNIEHGYKQNYYYYYFVIEIRKKRHLQNIKYTNCVVNNRYNKNYSMHK